MTRRSKFEILIDILQAVSDYREKPTHIMYRANLSWGRLTKLLDFLIKQELLKEINIAGKINYNITTKGREVLQYYKRLEEGLYDKKMLFTKAHY